MNEAENLMKGLHDQDLTVDAVADTLVTKYPELAYELSKVIDRWFNKSNMDKKNVCIELVCEILKKSVELHCKDQFLKGLAQRLKYFLQDLSRNYVSEGVALNVGRNIDSLKFKDLFCDEYFEKLQQLAKKIKENSNPATADQFLNSLSTQKEQKSYTRTFLKEYEDINNYPDLKAIYDTYIEYSRLEIQVGQQGKANSFQLDEFNMKFDDSFSLNNKSFSEMNTSTSEGRKEKCEQILMQFHTHMWKLRESMREEIQNYEESCLMNNPENRFESQNSLAE